MDFTDVVRRRRSVRAYEQRPVDAGLVDRLLDLARRGPSAGFSQGTDFVVLDDVDAVARFWSVTEDPAFPHDPAELAVGPPALVLAFSDPERYLGRYREPDKAAFGLGEQDAWPVRFWDTDTAMACMLLLLAAVDAGLGAWLFGIGHGEAELREWLAVPPDRNLVAIVALGYPAPAERVLGSGSTRARRPLAEQVHRNGW